MSYYEKRPPGENYTVPDFKDYFSIPDCSTSNAYHAELALNGVKIEGKGETAYNMLIRRHEFRYSSFIYANDPHNTGIEISTGMHEGIFIGLRKVQLLLPLAMKIRCE